jgi:hypothetical protein
VRSIVGMETLAPIKVGRVELSQDGDTVTITHRGKVGAVSVHIDAARVERWALRLLRDEAFSPDDQGSQKAAA